MDIGRDQMLAVLLVAAVIVLLHVAKWVVNEPSRSHRTAADKLSRRAEYIRNCEESRKRLSGDL